MAVEYPVTINEFNEAWPDGLDSKSQGDDHIRNIKGALKRTFPNVQGVSTISHHRLNELAKPGSISLPGMIIMWGSSVASIPAGWKLCNGVGTISNGTPVPNLVDRFVGGAGNLWSPGTTGGSIQHSHTTVIQGHALTVAQMPAHSHQNKYNNNTPSGIDQTGVSNEPLGPLNWLDGGPIGKTVNGSTAGSSQAHTHGVTVADAFTIPPFYALCFIIKD